MKFPVDTNKGVLLVNNKKDLRHKPEESMTLFDSINFGPIKVQDYNPEYWHVSFCIDGLNYLGRWYFKDKKNWCKTEADAAKRYIKEMKAEFAQEKKGHSLSWDFSTRIPIAEMVKEAELSLFLESLTED